MESINIINKVKSSLGYLAALLLVMYGPLLSAGMIDKEGMAPYEICGLCHNLDGISFTAKFPKLAGQKKDYITKQFLEFNQEIRINDGGQMVAITTEVDLSTLDAIAEYFSSLPPPPAAEPEEEQEVLDLGKTLFVQGKAGVPACAGCHGLEGVSAAPWIYAQHQNYIVKQLSDFKEGERDNDEQSVMRNIANKLSDDEMLAVAAYLESIQPRLQK